MNFFFSSQKVAKIIHFFLSLGRALLLLILFALLSNLVYYGSIHSTVLENSSLYYNAYLMFSKNLEFSLADNFDVATVLVNLALLDFGIIEVQPVVCGFSLLQASSLQNYFLLVRTIFALALLFLQLYVIFSPAISYYSVYFSMLAITISISQPRIDPNIGLNNLHRLYPQQSVTKFQFILDNHHFLKVKGLVAPNFSTMFSFTSTYKDRLICPLTDKSFELVQVGNPWLKELVTIKKNQYMVIPSYSIPDDWLQEGKLDPYAIKWFDPSNEEHRLSVELALRSIGNQGTFNVAENRWLASFTDQLPPIDNF